MGSKYTEHQKQQALALYAEHGPTEAGRRTGIPKATISFWGKKAGVLTIQPEKGRAAREAAQAMFATRRAELRVRLLAKAHELLDRMDQPHEDFVGKDGERVTRELPTAQAVRDYTISVATLIDKMRLELGEATGRHENVNRGEVDGEIDRLLAKLAGNDGATGAGEREHGSSRERAAV